MTDPAAARSGAAPQPIDGKEDMHEDDPSRVDGIPSDRPLGSPASGIEAIRARLATRHEPQIGTCLTCGHRQEIPKGMAMAHSSAESMWRCVRCKGQLVATLTWTANGPYPDEDIAYLLDSLAALAAARLAGQQENEELKQQTYPAYKREKALRCAAEAARTALRHELLALPRYQMSNGFVREWYVKASDLAERLAREEHPKAADA